MRFATALLLAATATLTSLVGCSNPSDSASDIVTSDADELASTGPTYAAGTTLRTTSPLNLRSSASTSGSVLRVMPEGATVTVRAASGGNAWVAVRFSGYDGWAHTSYLTKVSGGSSGGSTGGTSGNPGGYSASRGAQLARTALRRDGYPSGGWCALEVSNSVERSGVVPNGVSWYRNNAIDISEYMAGSTNYQNRVGFKRVGVSANDIPKGSVIGWRRGQCGYHSKYGHIEIAVDDSSKRACSDYCGSIKQTCGSPYVFMPTTL
jgi:hypothetical protein